MSVLLNVAVCHPLNFEKKKIRPSKLCLRCVLRELHKKKRCIPFTWKESFHLHFAALPPCRNACKFGVFCDCPAWTVLVTSACKRKQRAIRVSFAAVATDPNWRSVDFAKLKVKLQNTF